MNALLWHHESICMNASTLDVPSLAQQVYRRVCRTTFDEPGFCLVNVGRSLDSVAFRQLMVDLKIQMAAIQLALTGEALVYLSALRFDQQETTKPHLDGGPEQCFLMLGYEPSQIRAELEITDYVRCAYDLGLTPVEFMARHNPMFQPGYELIRPYATRVPCFSSTDFQIVCINNSFATYQPEGGVWLGTLHTATILTPDETKRRVINSTMIARAPSGTQDAIDAPAVEQFIHTSEVRRRGYDKRHLEDDR